MRQHEEDDDRQDPVQDKAEYRRGLLNNFTRECNAVCHETIDQPCILYDASLIDHLIVVLARINNLIGLDFDLFDLSFFRIINEGAVRNVRDLLLLRKRNQH